MAGGMGMMMAPSGQQLWQSGQAIGETLASYYMARMQGSDARRFARWVMANKYQLMVQDLVKAGLNPMLAVGASPGAPMPGIVSGSASHASAAPDWVQTAKGAETFGSDVERAFHEAARAGAEGARAEQEVRVGRAQEKLLDTQRRQAEVSTAVQATSLAGARAQEQLDETQAGKALRWINRAVRSLRGMDQTGAR